jgi:phage host-nuclease inhibitor protein Gam
MAPNRQLQPGVATVPGHSPPAGGLSGRRPIRDPVDDKKSWFIREMNRLLAAIRAGKVVPGPAALIGELEDLLAFVSESEDDQGAIGTATLQLKQILGRFQTEQPRRVTFIRPARRSAPLLQASEPTAIAWWPSLETASPELGVEPPSDMSPLWRYFRAFVEDQLRRFAERRAEEERKLLRQRGEWRDLVEREIAQLIEVGRQTIAKECTAMLEEQRALFAHERDELHAAAPGRSAHGPTADVGASQPMGQVEGLDELVADMKQQIRAAGNSRKTLDAYIEEFQDKELRRAEQYEAQVQAELAPVRSAVQEQLAGHLRELQSCRSAFEKRIASWDRAAEDMATRSGKMKADFEGMIVTMEDQLSQVVVAREAIAAASTDAGKGAERVGQVRAAVDDLLEQLAEELERVVEARDAAHAIARELRDLHEQTPAKFCVNAGPPCGDH